MNAKENQKSARVIYREYKDAEGNIRTEYKDTEGNIHTEYKDTEGNIHSYQNGYVEGQLAEGQKQELRVERADKNISKGLLIGVIVACVAGLTAGTIYFLTKQNNSPPVAVVSVPVYKSNPKSSTPPPPVRVVEQPIVTIVPVPQVQKPESTVNINTNVPNPPSKQESNNTAQPSKNSDVSVPIVINTTNEGVKSSTATAKPVPKTSTPPADGGVKSSTTTAKPTTPAKVASNSSANSSAQIKKDGDLKTEILNRFQKNLPKNKLIVEVKNGAVIVSGFAATADQLQQVQPLIQSIQGVGKVDITAAIASKSVDE